MLDTQDTKSSSNSKFNHAQVLSSHSAITPEALGKISRRLGEISERIPDIKSKISSYQDVLIRLRRLGAETGYEETGKVARDFIKSQLFILLEEVENAYRRY